MNKYNFILRDVLLRKMYIHCCYVAAQIFMISSYSDCLGCLISNLANIVLQEDGIWKRAV